MLLTPASADRFLSPRHAQDGVRAIAPHWPGGVGTPALASPTGCERKSLRGVWLTSLLFSHWPKERRNEGTGPDAQEASDAPVPPTSRAAKVSACGHASSELFLWGVDPREVSEKGCVGASHTVIFICGACAASQAAGGACWASAEVKVTPESHGSPPRLVGDLAQGPQAWAGCCRPPHQGGERLAFRSCSGGLQLPPGGPNPSPPSPHRLGLMSSPAVASLPAR